MVHFPELHQGAANEDIGPSYGFHDDLAGRIMWLPPRTTDLGLANKLHDHPVVVLSRRARADGKVDFFLMTSLKQTNLIKRHPSDIRKRAHYVPVVPAPRHPDNGLLLVLSRPGDYLNKPSYINTQHIYSTYFKELRAYRITPQRPLSLDKSSYARLVAKTLTTSTTSITATAAMTATTPRPAPRLDTYIRSVPTNYSIATSPPIIAPIAPSALLPTYRPLQHQNRFVPPPRTAVKCEEVFVNVLVFFALAALIALILYGIWPSFEAVGGALANAPHGTVHGVEGIVPSSSSWSALLHGFFERQGIFT